MTLHKHKRNEGMALDVAWVESARVNRPAVLRRAETHKSRRTVKKAAQLGWLFRVVTLIDLTTLAGDDTASNVRRLCHKAVHPVRLDMAAKVLGEEAARALTTGAICVYPNRVKDAKRALKGANVPIASVAAGFPAGQTPLPQRLAEIKFAVEAGATEIDIVISREHVINQSWQVLYDEVKAMREACGEAHLKTILATGELPTFGHVYKASLVCMMAGADFIKTSTGKEAVNATLAVTLVMVRAVREYHERTGFKVGYKPAGGIRSAKDACAYLALMKEELGDDWTRPDLFRIGASGLLIDVERQISHCLTGQYAGMHYMPKG